ncbi:hypothetical protein B0H17DRAFT_1130317 [Mycena rosella]|uniref:Uncharacterized protein n=1 Tax=Mycena rosella TaxID=1033263 RepID=A0AAD7DU01_MYCRO|nr:hypothetical protein B0H17DRAFT_1130317 [Mycena rosella]
MEMPSRHKRNAPDTPRLQTRTKNQTARPGLPDAKGTRRTAAEMEAAWAGEAEKNATAAHTQGLAISRVAAIEDEQHAADQTYARLTIPQMQSVVDRVFKPPLVEGKPGPSLYKVTADNEWSRLVRAWCLLGTISDGLLAGLSDRLDDLLFWTTREMARPCVCAAVAFFSASPAHAASISAAVRRVPFASGRPGRAVWFFVRVCRRGVSGAFLLCLLGISMLGSEAGWEEGKRAKSGGQQL